MRWEWGRKEEQEGTAATWGPSRALTLAPWPGLSGRCPSGTGSASRAMLPAAPGYARGRQLETTGYCLREEIYYRALCKAQIRLSRRREKTSVCVICMQSLSCRVMQGNKAEPGGNGVRGCLSLLLSLLFCCGGGGTLMSFLKQMLEESHSSAQRLKKNKKIKKEKERGGKKNEREKRKNVKSTRLAEIIFQKKRAWGWGRAGRRLSGCGKV